MEKTCRKGLHTYSASLRQCPECARPSAAARAAVWRAHNPEKSRASSAKWKAANLENARARGAAWRAVNPRAANPEKYRDREAAYRAANPEKYRVRAAAWRAANHEKARAYAAARHARNPANRRAANAAWAAANPEAVRQIKRRRRARKNGNGIEPFAPGQWASIVAFYGGCCAYCGTSSDRPTQDHVVPLARGGPHAPHNVVPACAGCNGKKHTQTWEPRLRHPWMEQRD